MERPEAAELRPRAHERNIGPAGGDFVELGIDVLDVPPRRHLTEAVYERISGDSSSNINRGFPSLRLEGADLVDHERDRPIVVDGGPHAESLAFKPGIRAVDHDREIAGDLRLKGAPG
jgi:hypothetical protein